MGLSLSLLSSAWEEIVKHRLFSLFFNISFNSKDGAITLRTDSFKRTESETDTLSYGSNKASTDGSSQLKGYKPENVMLERSLSYKDLVEEKKRMSLTSRKNELKHEPIPALSVPGSAVFSSPRPVSELDAAATKVQKVYKSYRTRRNLADCAVVVEELWWKALDSAALERSSVTFFDLHKPETAISRWARARTRAAKVGKGLSKDEKAQKLALQHWLEAIDPRHRYGHNLHLYYDVWFESESTQPFFYWLDIGDGKEINLAKCPRTPLHRQCIKYLGPKEREEFEVIVENGKLVYRQSGVLVETVEGSKWIFVLSTSRALYVGQKKKGVFQHSSFLAGAAITAAGRLVAHDGVLEAIWPYSGHYLPTEENFREFISFLEENQVNLSSVKRFAIDDDNPSFIINSEESSTSQKITGLDETSQVDHTNIVDVDGKANKTTITTVHQEDVKVDDVNVKPPEFNLAKRLSCKWSTGHGPRIGCVRDYPADLQSRALEQVNLSPRLTPGRLVNYGPIPSPRPSPKVRISPRLAYMGLPSPGTPIPSAC